MVLRILLGALLSGSFADAAIRSAMLRGRPRIPRISVPERSITDPNGTALPPLTTVYSFNQLIDHNDPSHGTFQQRYWMNWEFYRSGTFSLSSVGSATTYETNLGGPIILCTPGETNADGMLIPKIIYVIVLIHWQTTLLTSRMKPSMAWLHNNNMGRQSSSNTVSSDPQTPIQTLLHRVSSF